MTRLLAVACVALACMAPKCDAALKMKITDGVVTKIAQTNIGGSVFFNDSVGADWTVNVVTGLGEGVLNGPFPHLDLNSVNVSSSGGAGTLVIDLFSSAPAEADPGPGFTHTDVFAFDIGGTTAGVVTAFAWADDSLADFGTANLLGTLGPFGTSASGTVAFSDSAIVGPTTEETPYSAMVRVVIDHSDLGPGAVTSFNASFQAVPEPSAFLYGGVVAAIAGLGYRGRKWFGGSVEETEEA